MNKIGILLDKDVEPEEATRIQDAISMIRGVAGVDQTDWHCFATCWLMDLIRPYLKKLSEKDRGVLHDKLKEGVVRIDHAATNRTPKPGSREKQFTPKTFKGTREKSKRVQNKWSEEA